MTLKTLYLTFAAGVLGFFVLSASAGWKPPTLDSVGAGMSSGSGYRSYGRSGRGK